MDFKYTCDIVNHGSEEYTELIYLIDNSEQISVNEFYSHVKPSDYIKKFENKYAKIENSPLINCYKGKLPCGKVAVYFDYSRIEHVFY